jgi:hypothetical protein
MPAYFRSTTHSHSTHKSDQATYDQLEVEVPGTIGVVGIASRFVADNLLSISQIHRVCLLTKEKPSPSSLHNNFTVLGVELQTN